MDLINKFKDTSEKIVGYPDVIFTDYSERIKKTPINNVKYLGERGESKCISLDENVNKELVMRNIDGINFKNGYPDFGPVSVGIFKIDSMISNRDKNFSKVYTVMKESGYFKSQRAAKEFIKERDLVIHECPDCKTCMLVPKIIHEAFTHSGGYAECLAKDNKGGIFDE